MGDTGADLAGFAARRSEQYAAANRRNSARNNSEPQSRQRGRAQPRAPATARGRPNGVAGECRNGPRLRIDRQGGDIATAVRDAPLGPALGTAEAGLLPARCHRRIRGGQAAMSLSARVLAGFVLAYRYLLSPVLPMACRYSPTCSEYALEALRRFGALEGGWLAARRICRCHPWGGAGVDELPETAHGTPSVSVARHSSGSPECDRLRQTSAPASGSANAR
jgi:uncharacterized protein